MTARTRLRGFFCPRAKYAPGEMDDYARRIGAALGPADPVRRRSPPYVDADLYGHSDPER
jgi:hypothetical protein